MSSRSEHKTEKLPCHPTVGESVDGWYILGEEKISNIGVQNLGIFRVCRDKDCEHILKITHTYQNAEHEAKLQNECAEYGLCKPVEHLWECTDKIGSKRGVLVMSKLTDTFIDRLDLMKDHNRIWNMVKQALNLLMNLHKIGIIHGDTHR